MGLLNPTPPIPTIDFSNPDLNPGTLQWESVKSKVKRAMEDQGCFYALFSSADYDYGFQIDTFRFLESLFNVPQDRKKHGVPGFRSPDYSHIHRPQFPLFENLTLYDASNFEKLEGFVKGFLPQGDHSRFSKAVHSFTGEALGIQEIFRRMIVKSLGLEKYMADRMSSLQHKIRMTKYEAPGTISKPEIGLFPHVDTNSLTTLFQNDVSGLEVQSKDGDWIALTPPPNSFIILMAESLNAWANGRFHVPVHRVMVNAGNEVRYSIGLFPRPKDGYIVQAPEELVDEEHPLIYGPYDFSEFRKARSEAGKDTLQIKTFCGVVQPTSTI